MTRKSVTNMHNDNRVLAQLPVSICITAAHETEHLHRVLHFEMQTMTFVCATVVQQNLEKEKKNINQQKNRT